MGGAGTDGGCGTSTYGGSLIDELEAPGVCSNVAVGLSLSCPVNLRCSNGAVAPPLVDCSKNFSACFTKQSSELPLHRPLSLFKVVEQIMLSRN